MSQIHSVVVFINWEYSNYTMKTLVRCKDEIKAREEERDEKIATHKEITFGDVGIYSTFSAFLFLSLKLFFRKLFFRQTWVVCS